MTWLIVGTSMPRAATSVATRMRSWRERRPCRTRLRRPCGMPPCSDATAWPSCGQAIGEPVGVDLRAREDERLLDLALGQDVVEQRVLVGEVVGPVQALLDVGVGVGVRRDVDALRVAQQVLGEAGDVAEEGGAVHHRLARARHVVGDRRDVVDEAHVEHAIGFVEDQHLDVLEHGLAGLQVVEQAAGRRDQDVERAAQRLELRRIRHAADDGRDAQAGHVAAVHGRRLGDLHRQLARRRQDEDARAVDRALVAALAWCRRAPPGRVAAPAG